MKNDIPTFAGLLFPPKCIACDEPGHDGLDLCMHHYDELEWIYEKNPSTPIDWSAVDLFIPAVRHDGIARELITELKTNARLPHARTCAEIMWDKVKESGLPDALLPMPLTTEEMKHRGFNQATILSDMLNRHLELPTWRNEIIKLEHLKYIVCSGFKPVDHVAIITDTVTSGITEQVLASMLKNNGIKKVSLWSFSFR